jgi:hypothetical protein
MGLLEIPSINVGKHPLGFPAMFSLGIRIKIRSKKLLTKYDINVNIKVEDDVIILI